MSISRVQYAHAATTGSGAASLTCSFSAASEGDLLVAVIAVGAKDASGNETGTTPSGWTLVAGPVPNVISSTPVNLYLYYKLADGGETSVQGTSSGSGPITIQMAEWTSTSGWPPDPLDVYATHAAQVSSTPDTGTTAMTAQASEVWIGAISGNKSAQITYSAPSNGFTLESPDAWAGSSAFYSPDTCLLFRVADGASVASAAVTSSVSGWKFAGIIACFKDNAGGIPAFTPSATTSLTAAPDALGILGDDLDGTVALQAAPNGSVTLL